MLRQKIKRWRDVPGVFEKEFKEGVLRIHFTSSGYSDPGKTWGDPETCYPPEGEDERTLSSVYYEYDDSKCVAAFPQDIAKILFELYREEIDQVEIETEQDNERDPL